ncbi:MAG: prepilin-type N-terminal cleavage/methylation domain-containing protein [Fimbriimonadaceae bacterium]
MSAKRAFTIVEVLVAIFVLAVGITGLVGSIAGLTRAESAVSERDLIDRISHEKLDELVATGTWQSQAGGSFDDTRYSNYTWSIEEVNVGITNLTGLKLTVTSQDKGETTLSTIIYTPPAATGTGTAGGN